MADVFHEGELQVQAAAGVCGTASRVATSIRDAIPPAAQEFLSRQPMVIASYTAPSGRVWASLLAGAPGFMSTTDKVLRASPLYRAGDTFWDAVRTGMPIGLLAMDFEARRRARLNGVIIQLDKRSFTVALQQVFSNCSKYIQARRWALRSPKESVTVTRSEKLSPEQQEFIAGADTFFIASAHAHQGADASHRGGRPGFIRVLNATQLQWPDYKGNAMFQTLGNLAVNPAAGLLFVDWERGTTLQLTGFARTLPNSGAGLPMAGEERRVEFQLIEAVAIAGGLPFGWEFLEASPFNP